MSDLVIQKYDTSDSLRHHLNSTGISGSKAPHQSLRMGHWKQTSSNLVPRSHKHCVSLNEISKADLLSNQEHMPVQIPKSKEALMINADVNPSNISKYMDGQISEYGGLHPTSDILQSREGMITGRGRVEIIEQVLPSKNIKSFDTKPIRLNTSARRLQGSSVDSGTPFLYSGNLSSEWGHFTMFKINHKIDNAFTSNQKSGCGSVTATRSEPNLILNEFTSGPNEIKSTSECQFQPKCMLHSTDQWMKPYKLLQKEGLPISRSLRNDFPGSSSGSALQRFIERRNMGSWTCTKKEIDNFIPGLAVTEPFSNTNCSCLKQGTCKCTHCSAFLLSEKQRDKQIDMESLGSSWSGLKDASLKLLSDSWAGDFHFQISTGECSTKIPNTFGGGLFPSHGSIPKLTKLDDFVCEEQLPHRASACSVHNAETLRICTTVDSVDRVTGGPPKFSKAMQYLLITKKTDMEMSEGGHTIRESALSAESKENSFSAMHMLPPGLFYFGKQTVKLQPMGNSIHDGEKEGEQNTDSDFVNKQKVSSAKTDTMDTDIHQWMNSLEGVTSSKSIKGAVVGQNTEKSEDTSASPSKQAIRSPATELLDINSELSPCLDKTGSVGNRELSTSTTQSLDAKQFLSHVEKPEDSNSSRPLESPLSPQPSCRWVKRLRLNSLDSLALGTKTTKIGDATTSGRVNKLFSRVMNYSKSNTEFTLAKSLKERQQFDKTTKFLGTRESSMKSLKESDSWIRRWCHSSRGVTVPQARPEAHVLCEPESIKVVPDDTERKKLPSIAAMAMMGKAVNNFRPCEFRRRGSFVVWNTEGY